MAYHNTTDSFGDELASYEHLARAQDDRIYEYFTARPYAEKTPSQIHRDLFCERVPLTSVRRAMTNLTKRGLLEKTTNQKTGPYGRPEYLWRLPKGQQDMWE